MSTEAEAFLTTAVRAARAAQHPFPEMAACEAALESRWGQSKLATEAYNLFGMKQHQHPVFGTLNLPTSEYLHNQWVTVNAEWVKYPSLSDCFADRLHTLQTLAPHYPHYAQALVAVNQDQYITEVSKSWSTDPLRADSVLRIYRQYAYLLAPAA